MNENGNECLKRIIKCHLTYVCATLYCLLFHKCLAYFNRKSGMKKTRIFFSTTIIQKKEKKNINSISSFKRRRNSSEVDMNHESLYFCEIFIGAVNN